VKVLFFVPEFHTKGMKSIGVSLLSAILKRDGHETDLFDTFMYKLDDQFVNKNGDSIFFKSIKKQKVHPFPPEKDVHQAFDEKMEAFKPDVLAVSATYLQFKLFVHLFSKWGHPGIPVILGGYQAPPEYLNPFQYDFIDMVCFGEGDEALPELLRSMESAEKRTDIKNIWFRKNGKVIKNGVREGVKDLDNLPFLDWSIYPKHYFEKKYEGEWWFGGDLIHSRGCYNRCNYCYYDGYLELYDKKFNSIKFMSPERCVEEFAYVGKEYGVKLIKMRDSDFFARKADDLAKMVKLLKKKKDIPSLIVNAYPPYVTEEKVKLVKELNCVSIGLGVETGNEELRRNVLKKKEKNKHILKAVELIKKHNIRMSSLNMMGLPGETRKHFMDTVNLNRDMDVEVSDISILYPFPGTGIYDIAKEKGYLIRGFDDVIYFRDEMTLDMPDFSKKEMSGLIKTFTFYVKLHKFLFPAIKLAEKDNKIGKIIYGVLIRILKAYQNSRQYLRRFSL
jgi:radical SAM superfamily enzyme YgiQ (UPF0313 family)